MCIVQVVSNIWFLYVCTTLLICIHYMYMYNLVLMIPSFILVLPIFVHVFTLCICNYYSKPINIHVYSWVSCLHANSIIDSFVFRICMYIFSFDRTYICLEVLFLKKNNFYDFYICLIKRYSCFFWASLTIFMKMLLTWFLCTHTLFVYSLHCFHEKFWAL